MLAILSKHGIIASRESSTSFIGFDLADAGARWQPAAAKLGRLTAALHYMWTARRLFTGASVERLVGHIVHLAGLRPVLLSTLSATYAFIRHCYKRACPLWPSVRKELRWICSPLPLSFAQLDATWSGQVFAYDAPPQRLWYLRVDASGYGCNRGGWKGTKAVQVSRPVASLVSQSTRSRAARGSRVTRTGTGA